MSSGERSPLVVEGKLVNGLGAASETVQLQMPYFVDLLPDLKSCSPRTLNVALDDGLIVENPDLRTAPIPWAGPPGEVFDFVEVKFEVPIGGLLRRAWLYIPQGSPHRKFVNYAEIITEDIPGVIMGTRCRIYIEKPYRRLFVV